MVAGLRSPRLRTNNTQERMSRRHTRLASYLKTCRVSDLVALSPGITCTLVLRRIRKYAQVRPGNDVTDFVLTG